MKHSLELGLFNKAALIGGAFPAYQSEGIQFLLDHPRALLADDVGLGKTVQTAGALASLKATGELGQALIIAPAHLLAQWEGELHTWLPGFRVEVLDSRSKAAESPEVVLASYEYARNHCEALRQVGFSRNVLDEESSIKGGGVEHAAVRALTGDAKRVVGLTATPFENDAVETYQLLSAIRIPGLWPQHEYESQFVRFSPETVDAYNKIIPRKPIGWKISEVPRLREFINNHYLRRTADDVGLKLPARVGESIRWVPLLPSQQRVMRSADRLPASLRRHQKREHACNVIDGRSSKAEAAMDEILRRPDEAKFVIWAFHKGHLDVMQGLLDRHGIGWVRIDGTSSARLRTERLTQFRNDPDTRVLLGTDVFGSGLNLQHARVMLSLGSSYNPGKEAQREGRIRRVGSRHATYEHITFLNDCPHERAKAKVLTEKASDARALLD